ncbi:MAG: hypothetical protein IJM87_05260 [Ruminococcus sp.]|nr:hypothetical protein [Ruminococcus sp.]
MKKLCLSLCVSLVMSSACSMFVPGFGSDVKEHHEKRWGNIRVIDSKELEFDFAIGRFLKHLFG